MHPCSSFNDICFSPRAFASVIECGSRLPGLQDYFFPKEDAAAKQRQQQWAKSVALKRKTAAVVGETEKPAFHASSK